MVHSFKLSAAKAFGVEEAVMLNNILYWIKKNQANGRHQHDGKTWTYNSHSAFQSQFEYWTLKQIRRILDNLEKSGVIVTGNYNKKGYDKTKWYAAALEEMTKDEFDFEAWAARRAKYQDGPKPMPKRADRMPKRAHGMPKRAEETAQMGEPIPDTIPDIIPDDYSFSYEKEAPKKSKATSEKNPSLVYTLYTQYATFFESRAGAQAFPRTGAGHLVLDAKDARALKEFVKYFGEVHPGSAEEAWGDFLEAAWRAGDKWIRDNFCPHILWGQKNRLFTRAAKATAPRIQATDEEAEAVLRAMEELGR